MTNLAKAVNKAFAQSRHLDTCVIELGVAQEHSSADIERAAGQVAASLPRPWRLVSFHYVPAGGAFVAHGRFVLTRGCGG